MELYAQIACAMPRELARKGARWQDRAVYIEAILYCRENLTDGVVSRGELPFWMADMPVKQRAATLDELQSIGALLAHQNGWQFPPHVWSKWNPSRAAVEEKRSAEAQRKAEYRDRKRKSETETSENVPTGQPRTATQPRRAVPDSHSHSHSHSHSQSQSNSQSHASESSVGSNSVAATFDDDGIIDAIIRRCASIRTERHRPADPAGYHAAICADIRRTELDAIRTLLAERPHFRGTPDKAAAWYELNRKPKVA